MSIIERLHEGIDRLADMPPLVTLRRHRFDRRFESAPGHNLFRGVYQTYAEAQAACPATRPTGYDNPEAANMYADRRTRIHESDYPPMFWLMKLMAAGECRTILDLGGHVGVTYYAYSHYFHYDDALRWHVYDVPAVVRRGRELAAHDDHLHKLSFVDSLRDVSADVVIAYGSLQYLPDTATAFLSQMQTRPKHVILNMLPVHQNQSYFTVQDIGAAFCPYQIFAQPNLVRDFANAGYTLVDRWENLEKRCTIQFAPEHSLDRYYGYYFVDQPTPAH